jgi:hypothetical protein
MLSSGGLNWFRDDMGKMEREEGCDDERVDALFRDNIGEMERKEWLWERVQFRDDIGEMKIRQSGRLRR